MLSDEELDRLDGLLMAIPEEAGGMLISEFDGFCAGLIVSPEMILPGEWLPLVLGEGMGGFETLQELQAATDLVMRHYNGVAQALTPPGLDYAPLYDEDTRNGDILWESWACGFERAMRLRRPAWKRMIESGDEDVTSAVSMMVELSFIAEGESRLPRATIRSLTAEAPDLIPDLVLALNGWTKAAATPFPAWAAANRPHAPAIPPAARAKTGRNDPCPCGSGRKYKHCCGRN